MNKHRNCLPILVHTTPLSTIAASPEKMHLKPPVAPLLNKRILIFLAMELKALKHRAQRPLVKLPFRIAGLLVVTVECSLVHDISLHLQEYLQLRTHVVVLARDRLSAAEKASRRPVP
jgi:hypothetical protein